MLSLLASLAVCVVMIVAAAWVWHDRRLSTQIWVASDQRDHARRLRQRAELQALAAEDQRDAAWRDLASLRHQVLALAEQWETNGVGRCPHYRCARDLRALIRTGGN